jgi:undecaprenyl-diphosphatase
LRENAGAMIESIILGIVQGLTEFLPVSSTAHLILFPWFLNWTGTVDTLTFDIALHAGTLLALLLCFWRDWLELMTKKHRLLSLVFIGALPAGIAGFFMNDYVETYFRSPLLISVMLVTVGIVMLAAEKSWKFRSMDELKLSHALVIGIAQILAIVPGTSRSGITISAGLFCGLEREAAARFSFLLATPVLTGATLLHLHKAAASGEVHDPSLFVPGFLAAFVTGYLAIKFLLRFLKKYPLDLFVYYRFVLAIVIIAGVWLRG